jgi:hypothetical protein
MIQEISAALTGLKAATDIAKGINALKVGVEVDTKVSELLSTIIDLQHSMLELQSKFGDLQTENEHLKAQILQMETSATEHLALQFVNNVYWKKGDSTPFCPKCWEKDGKQIHLTGPHEDEWRGVTYYCTVCGNYVPV